jgi:hypothetical protein
MRREPRSRAAVLGRSEETRLSSPSDDEVGGCQARSALLMFAPPICMRSRRNPSTTELFSWMVVSSDPTKTAAPRRTSRRAKRAIEHSEHSERSNQIPIACRRAEEQRGDTHFVVGWRRGRRTSERDPQRAERAIKPRIARRRAEEKRGDAPFVLERRRSRRTSERDPQRAERPIKLSGR